MDPFFSQSRLEDKPTMVPLPDGSVVDINTKEGSNAFLTGVSSFDHFSSNLKEIRKLRKKKKLNAGRQKKLQDLYFFIDCIAGNANRELFREKIPESEIQDWLNYTIDEIKSFTNKQTWIDSGCLNDGDFRVIECCETMFDRHVVPVSLAFESEFFQVLANFVKARKEKDGRALPHALLCGSISQIALDTLATSSILKSWSIDKIFKKFEASGILEQILRCYTVPSITGSRQCDFMLVLGELESCTRVLTRKFKRGKPCGDTLQAILDGRDGSPNIQPRVVNALQGFARLAEALDPTEFTSRLASGTCSYCCSNNHDADLYFCSRCSFVVYCSKECQEADWETHKPDCREITTAERDRTFSLHMATSKFMNKNFTAVFEEMDKVCACTDLEVSDLAVEICLTRENGIIPALQDPAMFRVLPIQYYPEHENSFFVSEGIPADLQRSWLMDLTKNMEEAERKSTAGILVVHHANRVYIDSEIIKQYRQERPSLRDIQMKLGTNWCSNRLTAFHIWPEFLFDSQPVDSSFELL